MTDVIVFHHVQGLTDDVHAFADELRAAGHVVHVPDLLEGRTFPTIADGIANVQQIGFDTIIERGRAAVEGLPDALVYIGISLGVMPAQLLAQTRRGARAAVFLHSAIPPSEFGGPWPAHVPAQIHLSERDPEVLPPNGDLEAARAFAESETRVELFLYPGEAHLFKDYDDAAATLLKRRVHDFLEDR
ncbi:MAG TPA: dienelactone hydrolase family protein [Solirubrobacteraceae bacterium]|nr:dienelactone hydrolase family protein [Solirubrobacteraceae bacterium]